MGRKELSPSESIAGTGANVNRRFDLEGKKVVVVSRGHAIANAVAVAFRAESAQVAVPPFNTTQRNAGVKRFAAPVCAAVAALGGVDVLVTVTGIEATSRIGDASVDCWDAGFSEPLKTTFFATQAVLPALKAARGTIVNVTSVLGLMGARPGLAIPAAAMACAAHHTRMMALRLSTDGVRVNCLCHGYASNLERDGPESHRSAAAEGARANAIPLGRLGQPEDFTGSVLFLASPLSSYMTGTILTNDGGTYAGN